MSDRAVTVRLPAVWSWALPVVGGAVMFGLGFLVKPLFGWVTTLFESAPAPLRIAAMLPTGWAVFVLTLVGVLGGAWLAAQWRAGSLALTVEATGVRLSQEGRDRFVAATELASALRDGKDLVLLNADGAELSRNQADDLSTAQVRRALETLGCRWVDGSPIDHEFEPWVDGHPNLPGSLNELLRLRSGALTDGQAGTVYTVTEQLRAAGVAVRDRRGVQQYRQTVTH